MKRFFLFLLLAAMISSARAVTIFPTNSVWKFVKGTSEASSPDTTAWRTNGFIDTAWTTATAPFSYSSTAGEYPGNTSVSDMLNTYSCIFMRKTFVVTNVADFSEMQLAALSDDGYIAWINGIEVVRYNMPAGNVAYNGFASPALTEPMPVETNILSDPSDYLVPGTNVIAIQAFNTSLSSSDFVISPALSYTTDTTSPTMVSAIPTMNTTVRSLSFIEVDFSEGVTGVDASDLLINNVPATNLTVYGPAQYVFDFTPPATGTVQVTWAPGHGIHDLASTANSFAGAGWTYTYDPNAPLPGIQISEFMASNKDTLNDEDGDASDWIEIFNSSAASINLAGWSLSTASSNPRQWVFPNISLGANGYMVVFASSKNRTNVTANLHTNFKLPAPGGYLALLDPTMNIISSFAPLYPAQQTDVSYGRDRLSPTTVGYFTVPTPGAANNTLGAGFAPEVEFSNGGGTFTASFGLQLYTPLTNAVIYYTLDGTVPATNSLIYSGTAIPVTNSIPVRARAYVNGLLPGPVHSETYTLLNSTLLNTTFDLPVVVIYNYGGGTVPATTQQFCNISIYEPQNGVTSLTNAPTLSTRAGLKVHGSTSANFAKQSWSVEFWDDANDDKKLSPLGLPEDSDWIMYAPNSYEPVLMHNPLIYQLSNDVGRYAPRTRFVAAYLCTTAGAVSSAHYNGVYVLEEKIKRGKNRVDIDELEPQNNTVPTVTGGYMLKLDRVDPGDTGFTAAGQTWCRYVDPKEADIKTTQRAPQQFYITNYLNSFGTNLNGASYANLTNGFRSYVNVPTWIDHHILNVLAFNDDGLRLSAYFYKERSGLLNFGPIWDFDRSQGSTDGRDFNPRTWRSNTQDLGTDYFNYIWWSRMFTDINFWQNWIDRYQDLRAGILSTNHIFSVIDTFANQVRNEEVREVTKWGTFTKPRIGLITVDTYNYTFPGTYQGEVDFLKQWYRDRLNFMDTNFLNRPVLSSAGGPISAGLSLTMTGPSGASIYYTTNGTDPRLPGGAISSGAKLYSGAAILNNNARVVARSYNVAHTNLTGANKPPLSSPWSGTNAVTFIVSTPPLVVTEIMYSPADPTSGTNVAGDFEYVELKNIGATAMSLVGVAFTNGIEYTFTTNSAVTNLAAGKTVLLVKNQTAFSSRYPGVTNVGGIYTGSLDNSGERLTLTGGYQEPVLDFTYDNKWYPITDGGGFSLVIVNENAALNTWGLKSSWRPSGAFGGSPGTNDAAPSAFPAVLVTEALTHTDLPQLDSIELFNSSASAANIGGWFLTDNFSKPKKYRIPNGTTIPADGYLVIDENSFNVGTNAFRFSSLGEEVYLFSGDANTNLTGYVHGFPFGAAKHGISFGRYVTSTGEEKFVAQITNTLGAVNSGPRVGPLVISELMYSPAPITGTNNNTLDEYIEIRNVAPQMTYLYDTNYPTNTWHLGGAITFAFPLNMSLAANSYVVVVGFDPFFLTNQLAAFRARFGFGTNVTVVGPWTGNLNNAGDVLQLFTPDTPQPPGDPDAGLVPYVLVDQVSYANAAPWPTNADATGLSLQRINSNQFGDDPINWRAAAPTIGAETVGSPLLDFDGDGLPDAWELANGLDAADATGVNGPNGDPDGDRLTNLQEFIAGTNPHDAASFLKINSIDVSFGQLKFTAVAGKTYSLMSRTNLTSGSWQKLLDIAASPSTGEITITNLNLGATTRFYQLVTPQLP